MKHNFTISTGQPLRFGCVYAYRLDNGAIGSCRAKKSDLKDGQVYGSLHLGQLTNVTAFGGGRSIRRPKGCAGGGQFMSASEARLEQYPLDLSRMELAGPELVQAHFGR